MHIRDGVEQDCSGIARVQVNSYRSAYAGIFPDGYINHFTYEEQEGNWQKWFRTKKDEFLLVAEDQERNIIGYTLIKIDLDVYAGYEAEVVGLHVSKPVQQQGTGKALLAHAVEELNKLGISSVMLWTLRENPVRGWYEQLGGKVLGEKRYDVDDREIVEIAYGWADIYQLAQSLG